MPITRDSRALSTTCLVTVLSEGVDAARARGQSPGRPAAMDEEQIRHARALLAQPDATVASIARLLHVSRATVYKHVPELSPARGVAAVPAVTA